jgi:hypothetical protein
VSSSVNFSKQQSNTNLNGGQASPFDVIAAENNRGPRFALPNIGIDTFGGGGNMQSRNFN